MNDQQARQTPLIDLLRDIPADARMVYEVTPTHHQSIPVGVLAKNAADEIERLRAERDEHACWREKLADDLHDRETRISDAWQSLRDAGVQSEQSVADGIELMRRQLAEAAESIAAQARTIADLSAALVAACELLQVDRMSLYETARNRATGEIDDPVDQAALDDYDRVIAQADAALGSER